MVYEENWYVENRMKFEGQIECISILRVVGALGIALYHIGTFNDHIATLQAGVSLFFCISAFLMMYTTQKGASSHYILKRLIRIVPLYWIMTAFTFAAMQVVPSISTGGGYAWVHQIAILHTVCSPRPEICRCSKTDGRSHMDAFLWCLLYVHFWLMHED